MKPYGDGERQSGVIAFESGEDYIRIRFKSQAPHSKLFAAEIRSKMIINFMLVKSS